MEGAGTVHAVGSDVTAWQPGDRVIFGVRPGAFAEYVKVSKPDGLMRLPDGWSEIEGAGYRVAAHTAYHSLVHRAAVKKGDVVLVHGASGGVGLAAVQLAKHLGARVIATGGDDARLAVVKRHGGADEVVNYRTAGLRRGGEGADRRQGRRRDLRSGRRRGAGEIDARGGLRRAAADRRLHLGRSEQDHVEPRADQGPLDPRRARRRDHRADRARTRPRLCRDTAEARGSRRDAPAHLAPLPDGAHGRRLPRPDRPSGDRQGRHRDGENRRPERSRGT